MTPEDAKFILQAYRPDGRDASDEAFCAAVKMAQEDPALGAWFERQQAFDRAVAAKLREVAPPAELRAAILTGGQVSRQVRAAWWQQPRWVALAAGLLVVLSVSLLLRPKEAFASAPLMAFVANDARHSELHGGSGAPAGALVAMLSEPTTHLGNGLPINFDNLRSTGCRSIDFQGHPVLEVCFKRDGNWFHCYVMRQADFPLLASPGKPVISELGQVDIATWADSAHVFLVAGEAGRRALQGLL